MRSISGDPGAVAAQAVRQMAADPLSAALSDEALADSVQRLGALAAMVAAEQARRIAEIVSRGSHRSLGARTCEDLLAQRCGLTRREAAEAVRTAKALQRLPKTAKKMADGKMTPGHAATAARGLADMDRRAAERAREAGGDVDKYADADRKAQDDVEEFDDVVAGAAGEGDRLALGRRLDGWRAKRDPDELADRDRRATRRRGLWFDEAPDSDGLTTGGFRLLPGTAARLRARVGAAARKRPGDDRTLGQRQHDALDELAGGPAADREAEDAEPGASAAERPPAPADREADDAEPGPSAAERPPAPADRPADGGAASEPVGRRHRPRSSAGYRGRNQVLLIGTGDGIAGVPGAEPPTLDGVGPVSSATAQAISCDAEVTTVVMRGKEILDIGWAARDATAPIRKAVIARDRVCLGCGAPAAQCELHHVVHWVKGGKTAVTNLVLLCWNCHHHVHHEGWRIRRLDGGGFAVDKPAPDPVGRSPD